MPRRGLRLPAAVGALAVLALLATPAVSAAPAGKAAPALSVAADAVVVAPHDFANADALIGALASDGARPAIVYLPRTVLARVSAATAVRLRCLGFAVVRAHAAPPAGGASETAAALAALNSLADGAAAAAAGDRPVVPADLPSLGADLKLSDITGASGAPPSGLAAPAFLGLFATVQTATAPAAYAAGSVAVCIIFPQSTKTAAGRSESWKTPDPDTAYDQPDPEYPKLTAREGYIVAEVSKTLLWWQSQAPAAVHLTFVIPSVGKLGAPQQVAVNREPITIASTNDGLWRHPIMAALHHKAASAADSPPPERAYDNAVRKANGTDWAFTLYCVDSLNTTRGEFPDGAFAYTFDVFGPYTVTTWGNDGYGPGLYDGVLAHEIGHVFGALDEYAPPTQGYPSTGDLYSGYLWVRNRNAVKGGTTDDVCIMRGGSEGIAAYEGQPYGSDMTTGGICPSTRGQIGWRDANGNGIADVVDTTPTVTLKPPTADGATATVAGVARENPCPPGHNAKGRAFAKGISVLVPHDVRYSADGGAWIAVSTPGTAATESFGFTTAALTSSTGAPTRHVITVRATTGNTAAKSIVAWTAPTPVTLTLTQGVATIALGAKIKLTVSAADTDAPQYPIGFLPGVTVGPLGGAATSQKSVTTGAGGRAAVAFAPRVTTTFQAAFQPGAQSMQFTAATPARVTVAVRALLTARAGVASGTRVVRVTGAFRPVRGGVPLVLQLFRAGSWKAVAHTRTTARSTFRLVYAAHPGAVRLRVRFAGDAHNAAAVRALPSLAVS